MDTRDEVCDGRATRGLRVCQGLGIRRERAEASWAVVRLEIGKGENEDIGASGLSVTELGRLSS